MNKLLFLLLLIASSVGFSQSKIDSLWGVWNDLANPDSTRLDAINYVIRRGVLFTKPDSAFTLAETQYNFAKKTSNQKDMAAASNTKGVACHIQGDYYNAIKYYNTGLKIARKIGNQKLEASSLNNIGIIYKEKKNYERALTYFQKSYKIKKEINDMVGVSNALGNIGGIHSEKGEDNIAIDYYLKGIKIQEEIGNQLAVSSFLNNIGSTYAKKKEYVKALDNFEKSLAIRIEINDRRGQSSSLNRIATLFYTKGEIDKSIYYNQRAFDIANEIGVLSETLEASKGLYNGYKINGNTNKALEMYEIYIATNDSLNNKKNEQEIIHQEYKYEYEKQHLADSLNFNQKQEMKDILYEEQLSKEQNQRYYLYIGIGFLILLGGLIFLGYTRKKRANELIEKANEELAEKNQEITDSITYAKRIQNAILPPAKVVKEYLQESFILYKPKDIVAGDFYWLEQKEGKVLFAAADCTGHGVPGAMVSVVCNNALNRAVREHGLTDSGKILDKAREIIIEEFEKSDEEVKDGMDIAICSIKETTLQYSGANNPLWIIRKGELIETKANKQPIGKFDNPLPYTTHTFELEQGDSIYIFSDGYVDQFGGEQGKKFKAKAFRELLLSIQDKTMEEQKTIIDKTFETWKGSLEQIDDVCIIGVRI